MMTVKNRKIEGFRVPLFLGYNQSMDLFMILFFINVKNSKSFYIYTTKTAY